MPLDPPPVILVTSRQSYVCVLASLCTERVNSIYDGVCEQETVQSCTVVAGAL